MTPDPDQILEAVIGGLEALSAASKPYGGLFPALLDPRPAHALYSPAALSPKTDPPSNVATRTP